MSRSVFYNQACGRRFPVSLLALEYYAVETQKCESEDELFDVFMKVVVDFCGVSSPNDEDLNYFVERLNTIRTETERSAPLSDKAPRKSFGTSYDSYLQRLTLDSTVLRMVGYDVNAAHRIYCEMDRDDAMKLIGDYVTGLMEEGLLQLEASMYGFGGKYKDDKGGPGQTDGQTKTHDLTTDEGKAALRRLGF